MTNTLAHPKCFYACLLFLRWGISSAPSAANLSFQFHFLLLMHLSGCLAYLQLLVLILCFVDYDSSLTVIAATWAILCKLFYVSHGKLQISLSLCWSWSSDTYKFILGSQVLHIPSIFYFFLSFVIS